jgi:hypothetical protein
MVEDESGKCLIVAISDSVNTSDLEFYDLSTEEFKVIRRVSLQEVFDELKKRIPHHVSPSQQIIKLSIKGSQLTVYLTNGTSLVLDFTIR